MSKKYAIYSRVSTFEQNIEIQNGRLINYAENNNFKYELFQEKESTRKTRPVKQRLMLLLKNGEYDGVIVTSLDRWARDLPEMISSINNILAWNLDFKSIDEDIDFNSQSGQEFIRIYGIFAQVERNRISERTKEALQYKKLKGQSIGRPKGSKDKKKRKTDGYYKREEVKRLKSKIENFSENYSDMLSVDELGKVGNMLDLLPFLMVRENLKTK